jgi:hypothetical protein
MEKAMSILERRKLKAAHLALTAPVAALAVLGVSASKSDAAAIGSGDVLVFQAGSSTTDTAGAGGSTLLIQDINPSSPGSAAQTFNITSDEGVYTNSNGSNGLLDLSDNNTLLTFGGYVGTNSSNELTQTSRAAVAIDGFGNVTEPATYTESSGGQTRAAYSPDGSTYYFGDKSGVFLGGSTSPANAANVRSLKGFGGTLYASEQNNATSGAIYTVSSDGTTVTQLPGITGSNKETDFVMLQSGVNGSTFDTLYIAEAASIAKYADIAGTWTAEGTITAAGTVVGLTASELGSDTGANLVYTTSSSLFEQPDNSAFNATASGGSSTLLYTAPTGDDLFGVSLAPVPEPASLGILCLGAVGLLARRRRKISE